MLHNGNIQRARSLSIFVDLMKAVFVCLLIWRLFVRINKTAELSLNLLAVSELLIALLVFEEHPAFTEEQMQFPEAFGQPLIRFLRLTGRDIHIICHACPF